MAVFSAAKCGKQNAAAMARVIDYVEQKKKTLWEGQRLITGVNCVAQSAYTEMMTTKQRYHKTDGMMFYHFSQSFPKDVEQTPLQIHAIGLELAQRLFPGYEVVVATHVDADHLHNHFVVNSVNYEMGRKLHQNAADFQRQREINDEICAAHGLEILEPANRYGRSQGMGNREYRSAVKGESWKFRLMNVIDDCMKYAHSKEEFVALMGSEGYEVQWTDGRKSITYTCPNKMKCRDYRLHDTKYLKEMMEREFRIRSEIIYGRTETVEYIGDVHSNAEADNDASSTYTRANNLSSDRTRMEESSVAAPIQESEYQVHERTNGRTFEKADEQHDMGAEEPAPAAVQDAGVEDRTGWEAEREILLAAEAAASEDQAPSDMAANPSDPADLLGDVAQLGHALERMADAPAVDSTTMPGHTDSKAQKKQREKKIAMGHKADDHEEPRRDQGMTMG